MILLLPYTYSNISMRRERERSTGRGGEKGERGERGERCTSYAAVPLGRTEVQMRVVRAWLAPRTITSELLIALVNLLKNVLDRRKEEKKGRGGREGNERRRGNRRGGVEGRVMERRRRKKGDGEEGRAYLYTPGGMYTGYPV